MTALRPSRFLFPLALFSATGWLLLGGAPMADAQGPDRDNYRRDRGRGGPVYDGWTSFFQPQYGFLLPVPPGIRAQGDPFSAKRAVFTSLDGDFQAVTWGGYSPGPTRPSLEEQWMESQSQEGRRVEYRRWGGNWFELSGISRNGRAFYEKLIRRGEFYAVFNTSYTPSRLNEYRPWMDGMSDGFTYNATPPPRHIVSDPDNLGETQRRSGFRRFWSGLIDERPEPRALPRRLEPWDGDRGNNNRDSRTNPENPRPEYSDGRGAGSNRGGNEDQDRLPRSTGPIDLTPPPATLERSDSNPRRSSQPPPTSQSRSSNDRTTAPVPPASSGTKSSGRGSSSADKPAKSGSGSGPSSSSGSKTKPSGTDTPSTSPKRDDLPFGVIIPGKKGFVYSPFSPDKGPVDVQDIPAGTKVRCPYSGKVFRVP
ncbi:MAG: hypothetical protein JWM59_1015 [Verrucomicrobiales bacterium]|nr:hypothetical protein [Verrucomicrobiales bacterium]